MAKGQMGRGVFTKIEGAKSFCMQLFGEYADEIEMSGIIKLTGHPSARV